MNKNRLRCPRCTSIQTNWHRERTITVKDINNPSKQLLAIYSLCHKCYKYFTTHFNGKRASGVMATERLLYLVHKMKKSKKTQEEITKKFSLVGDVKIGNIWKYGVGGGNSVE